MMDTATTYSVLEEKIVGYAMEPVHPQIKNRMRDSQRPGCAWVERYGVPIEEASSKMAEQNKARKIFSYKTE